MDSAARYITVCSSLAIRTLAFVFLRWIPGTFVPLTISAFAVYVPAFVYITLRTSRYVVTSNEVDIVTTSDFDHDAAKRDIDQRLVDPGALDDVGEELTVQETLVLEERDPAILKTLLTGLPSPSSMMATLATLMINVGLTLMVLDYTFRATTFYQAKDLSFVRVGFVSDTTATILVREPREECLPLIANIRTFDYPTGFASAPSWREGGHIKKLDESTDFTGSISFAGLRPDARYEFVLSNNKTGQFVTAPRKGHLPPSGSFTFLHSSCLKNNFPYNPLAHPLSNRGLRYLQDVLARVEAQFMLFLGDFIYIDVPMRHGASTVEDYRREYRQIYASPDWPAPNVPWIHVYDDHEIANDWDKNTTGFFPAAFDPYQHYHIAVNPPAARRGATYFEFTSGPAAFFMLDTRRYRSPNDGTNGSHPITGQPTKSMLGQQQLEDLLTWLKKPEPAGVRWKILVSSVPFTKNWWFGAQDTWRGYLGERQIILEAMWDVGRGVGVVILSGDRHEFAATAFSPPPEGKSQTHEDAFSKFTSKAKSLLSTRDEPQKKRWPASAVVHEFSASPLGQFYLPIRTYSESSTSSEYVSDVCIKYLPDGNSKVGAVSITSPESSEQSVLQYRLFVDGKEAWSHTIVTPQSRGEMRDNAIWG